MATTRRNKPPKIGVPLTVTLANRYRFSAEEYHRMAGAGIFGEDDRVELIDGDIIEMSPIGWKHVSDVNRTAHVFSQALGHRAIVQVQSPVGLTSRSEPQPDIVILRWRDDFYPDGPGPEDTLLIVEVADTSLRYDREEKALVYARAGVPEYWVEQVNRRSLLVFRDPSPDGYRTVRELRGDEPVNPLAFPDLVVTARLLLPPSP